MLINKKILSEGFTLTEMLVTMLIASSVTVSMFYVLNQINLHMQLEANKYEINNYANIVLEEISINLRKAQEVNVTNRPPYNTLIETKTLEWNDEDRKYDEIAITMDFDLKDGLTIIENESDSLRPGFLPIDWYNNNPRRGRKKYEFYDFDLENVGFTFQDIYSTEAQNARNASKNLHLEILLYSKFNQQVPSDTLKYNRRVFCPSLLVTESSDGI